jgi:hypothetical protein
MGHFTPNGKRPRPPALFPLRPFYRELTPFSEGNGRGCVFSDLRGCHTLRYGGSPEAVIRQLEHDSTDPLAAALARLF